ncbi:hypothetical protein M5C99_03780 [Acidovorax sp. NCPPB 2350]|nr:hypothetical protein M5C99_03780 [Acidovorax sp. NCPPB 2350]
MVLGIAVSVGAVLKAMPWGGAIVRKMEKVVTWTTVAAVAVTVPVLVVSRPLQNHFLPQWGYSRCDALKGQPTPWFSDWVRDPAWCVRGKSPEWVDAQARAAVRAPAGHPRLR